MRLKIFPPAARRLGEIWEYTFSLWGAEQADSYVDGLHLFLSALGNPDAPVQLVKAKGFRGVFQTRYRRHYVYFRMLDPGTIGVLTILHEKMDVPNRLRADFRRLE